MPHKFALALLAALIVATPLFAQDSESSDYWRIIFSDGDADTLVEPDEIVFFLHVDASHLDIDSARMEHKKKMEKLTDLTKKMKISSSDIRMDLLDIEPDYLMRGTEGTDFNPRAFSSNSDEPELQEYHVTRSITITLRDHSKYTDFLAGILSLDIDLQKDPLYRASNADEIRQMLTLQAIRDARVNAERLASEVGMKVVDPIRIGEPDWYDTSEYSYSSYNSRYGNSYSGSEGTRSPLTLYMISLRVTVSVTFQMISN